jgi:hypothetical protein
MHSLRPRPRSRPCRARPVGHADSSPWRSVCLSLCRPALGPDRASRQERGFQRVGRVAAHDVDANGQRQSGCAQRRPRPAQALGSSSTNVRLPVPVHGLTACLQSHRARAMQPSNNALSTRRRNSQRQPRDSARPPWRFTRRSWRDSIASDSRRLRSLICGSCSGPRRSVAIASFISSAIRGAPRLHLAHSLTSSLC